MPEEYEDPVREAAAGANALHRPVRIEHGVVTRPAHPGSAAVHDLLRYLRAAEVDEAPEPLRIDGGQETLRLIAGESGGRGWYHQHSEAGLRSAARLLRRVHDASLGWTPPEGAVLDVAAVPVAREDVVWCHGDFGPWNVVWRDEQAIGLIDWDYLHRGPRFDDIGYALRWFVPLRADEHVLEWHHFPQVPDRRARIAAFLAAYGPFVGDDADVVDAVVAAMTRTIDCMSDLASRGIEPQRTWVADGALEAEREEIAWVEAHRRELR